MHKRLFHFLESKVSSQHTLPKLQVLTVVKKIRYNQLIAVWYLSDGGRINKIEGYTLTSYRGRFSLIFLKELDSDRVFGFTPFSPRLVLVR